MRCVRVYNIGRNAKLTVIYSCRKEPYERFCRPIGSERVGCSRSSDRQHLRRAARSGRVDEAEGVGKTEGICEPVVASSV